MSAKEVPWSKIFARVPLTRRGPQSTKCTCGNGNCRTAKGILCTCKCHSLHHGEANRVGMEPLDKTLALDGLTVTVTKEATDPLPSPPEIQRLSRELIYLE